MNISRILILYIILLISFLAKLSIINYGLPYVFNPDESYILKEPFKLIFLYSNFSFTSPTNLFYWMSTVWWGVIFFIGILSGKWESLENFQNLVIVEDQSIIFFGRLFSIVLSTAAGLFLMKIVLLFKNLSLSQMLLYFLILIFNPIVFFSNTWIKYDPAVYLFSSVLLYIFILRGSKKEKFTISDYILVFAAISVRIDLILFLIIYVFLDIFITSKAKLKNIPYKGIIIGLIFFSIINFLPLKWYNDLFIRKDTDVKIAGTFTEVIYYKIFEIIKSGKLIVFISNNLINYLSFIIASILPCAILFLLFLINRINLYKKLLILFVILNFSVIIIYHYSSPHYILNISMIILILGLSYLYNSDISGRLKNWLLSISFLYQFSVIAYFVIIVNFATDPRIEARMDLLNLTDSSDVIAIEYYMVNGFPLEECSDVLRKKSEIIKREGIGTGETFRLQSERSDTSCRKIVAIHSEDVYAETSFKNVWILTPEKFPYKENVNYLVKVTPVEGNDLYNSYVRKNFTLFNAYRYQFFDPRTEILALGEYFFSSRYIYKKIIHE